MTVSLWMEISSALSVALRSFITTPVTWNVIMDCLGYAYGAATAVLLERILTWRYYPCSDKVAWIPPCQDRSTVAGIGKYIHSKSWSTRCQQDCRPPPLSFVMEQLASLSSLFLFGSRKDCLTVHILPLSRQGRKDTPSLAISSICGQVTTGKNIQNGERYMVSTSIEHWVTSKCVYRRRCSTIGIRDKHHNRQFSQSCTWSAWQEVPNILRSARPSPNTTSVSWQYSTEYHSIMTQSINSALDWSGILVSRAMGIHGGCTENFLRANLALALSSRSGQYMSRLSNVSWSDSLTHLMIFSNSWSCASLFGRFRVVYLTSHLFHSHVIQVIMLAVYGISVDSRDNVYVNLAEKAVALATEGLKPGTELFTMFPFCECYLWFSF